MTAFDTSYPTLPYISILSCDLFPEKLQIFYLLFNCQHYLQIYTFIAENPYVLWIYCMFVIIIIISFFITALFIMFYGLFFFAVFNQKVICLISGLRSQTQSKPDHTNHVGCAGSLSALYTHTHTHTQLGLVIIFSVADSHSVIRIVLYFCRSSEFMQYRCWRITHTITLMIYSLYYAYSLVFLLLPSTHTHTVWLLTHTHLPTGWTYHSLSPWNCNIWFWFQGLQIQYEKNVFHYNFIYF